MGSSVRIDSSSAIELPAWVTAASDDISFDSSASTDMVATGQATNNLNGLPDVNEVAIFRPEDKGNTVALPDLIGFSLFLPLCVMCLSILMLHRFFPKACCPYDHFAQHNEIKDTHAVRKVKSRIGGAFTYTLIITASFLMFTSIANRNYSTSTSDAPARVELFERLVKKTEASEQLSFGQIEIDVEGYVPIDPITLAKRCKLLTLTEQRANSNATAGQGSSMECRLKFKNNDPTTCGVTVICDASFVLRGSVSVALSIPGEFQTLAWQVKSTSWEFFEKKSNTGRKKWMRYETTVNNTLTSGSSASIMKGTIEKPTSVKFGLTRG